MKNQNKDPRSQASGVITPLASDAVSAVVEAARSLIKLGPVRVHPDRCAYCDRQDWLEEPHSPACDWNKLKTAVNELNRQRVRAASS